MFTQEISQTDSTLTGLDREISSTKSDKTLQKSIHEACDRVAPIWPLTNFIAANPLKGYEDKPFSKAAEIAERFFHGRGLPTTEFFHEQFRKGRITVEDLVHVLDDSAAKTSEKMAKILVEQALDSAQKGVSDRPLDRVFLIPSEWLDHTIGTRLYSWSQSELTKWCASYFDLGQATWPMPNRELGFYGAWKRLAVHDRSYELAGVKGFRDFVASLPEDAEDAILMLCTRLEIPSALIEDYFARHFASLPGWSGMFSYRGSERQFLEGANPRGELIDWLAVRIAYDIAGTQWAAKDVLGTEGKWSAIVDALRLKLPATSASERDSKKSGAGSVLEKASEAEVANPRFLWLRAYERNYRIRLLNQLEQGLARFNTRDTQKKRPQAQAVFCIDVRSEGFRRHLEQQGDYETFGFAGFFAIPLAHRELGSEDIQAQCPVLLRPKYLIEEASAAHAKAKEASYLSTKKALGQLSNTIKEVKTTSIAPFSFVETFGGLSSLGLALRTFLPSVLNRTKTVGAKALGLEHATLPVVEAQTDKHELYTKGIPLADQVAIAENSLRFMGFTRNFAKLVLLCGHGSTSTNNPYASALDCGACGGHRGAPNSRVAAAILNSPAVRAQLIERGIQIPEDTWFVAAEHNTTNDSLDILEEDTIPSEFKPALSQVKNDLRAASARLNLERTKRFSRPASSFESAVQEVNHRGLDWSEVRPEWGLAGNAAFIIARREVTRGLDLQCRTFLHSYRWEEDKEGTALEVIMTAPMIVTQWINSQYYFSSVDNEVFGSGNKTIHNVVGKIGVMQGNFSDIKMGLPLQSVSDGQQLQHEPMRLAVVIEAPRDRIRSIAEKHDSIRRLVQNEWIRIVAMDPATHGFQFLDRSFEWQTEA